MMRDNITVILARPQSPENIGLVARCMQNTGFKRLRLVWDGPLPQQAFVTAVHSEEILQGAEFFPGVAAAVADLGAVYAAVARKRRNFPSLTYREAVEHISITSSEARIGLLFGNERTGLESSELLHSNFRFQIPQASSQPSYNLASAVLLSLFPLSQEKLREQPPWEREPPLPRAEQVECFDRILSKLEDKDFIHPKNKAHVTDMVYDLFGRLNLSEKDRDLLLAIFSKGVDQR
jgi:TrmH family RNA methyltransferase